MKKYKLLKDLPWIPAGSIIEETKDWKRLIPENERSIDRYIMQMLIKAKEEWRLEEEKNDTAYNGMCVSEPDHRTYYRSDTIPF